MAQQLLYHKNMHVQIYKYKERKYIGLLNYTNMMLMILLDDTTYQKMHKTAS